jgi:hypothetical protein
MAINYTVGDNWGSGFVGNIVVPGGASGLHGWTLEFDATFDISNIWGAEIVSACCPSTSVRWCPGKALK